MTVDRASLEESLQKLHKQRNLRPFCREMIDFSADFSTILQRDPEAAQFPELKVLGFHMRRAAVSGLQRDFEKLNSGECVLVPRGLVFHIPPGNVDTIFVYSWLLSALAGNRNVIRISSRESPQTSILLRILQEVRGEAAEQVRSRTLIVRYGHERDLSETISAAADVRVIWGGDRAVNEIRSIPLAPHAREVTFPDRYSMSIIKAADYLASGAEQRAELAHRFYNDMFWFDQAACSSPRLLIWLGSEDDAAKSSQTFVSELQARINLREYRIATGAYLGKLAFAYGAIASGEVSSYDAPSSELSLLTLTNLAALRREHCGSGLLFQGVAKRLEDVAEIIDRRDQTLTHFGFTAEELRDFAGALNGRGIDRMVPIGDALTFHRYWDGCDLLQEMTRRVHIRHA